MIVIYYKNREGKITYHHRAKEEWTKDELIKKIEQFNSETPLDKGTAHYAELTEGSFERYLLECTERGIRQTKETIAAALDALDEARDCISSLEVAK